MVVIDMFRILILMLFVTSINAFDFSDKTVIVVDKENRVLKNVANDLSFYIENITGVKPDILTTVPKDKSAILIKKIEKKEQIKDGRFSIKTKKDKLTITAFEDNGLYFGVYYFLENYLGCKFLSNSYEYIPKFSKKFLGDIDDFQKPKFLYREIFIAESDDWVYSLKNRLNGRLGHRSVIDDAQALYSKGVNIYSFSSHELFGEKFSCDGQYDFLDKDAQKYASQILGEKLSSLDIGSEDYIILAHEDRASYCKDGLKDENPSYSFLKYATFLAKKYPNYNFLAQSYLWSRKPPKEAFVLPKNLGVMFSGIESNFAKPITSFENEDILKDLKAWDRVTDKIFYWHYIINFGGYMLPFPDLYAVDKDIKELSNLSSVKGLFLQGSYGTYGGELANLRVWVFSKLLWDPTLDIDELIEEFCNYYYGKASDDVVQYIKTLHKFISQSDDKLSVKTSINVKYLKSENLNFLDEILSNGLKKVENEPLHKKHLIDLFSGIDYIRLLRVDKNMDIDKIKKRFKTFLRNNPNISSFAEGVKIDNIIKIIDLDRKLSRDPYEARGLKKGVDWFEYQEYELELCCNEIVADAKASDGVSVRMDGDKDDWGFGLPLLNLKDGKWDIYASVKIEIFEDHNILDNAKIALFYGIYPTIIKGASVVGQFANNRYRDIKIGSIDSKTTNAKSVWLSPPANDVVKYLFVDRIFLVKKDR